MEQTDPKKTSLWQYVPLSEYAVPQATVSHTIKGGIFGLWQKLFPPKHESVISLQKEEALQILPDEILDCVAPLVDLRVPALSLETALLGENGSAAGNWPYVFVVGPPFSSNSEILNQLALATGSPVISTPSVDQILTKDTAWLEQFQGIKTPWILPCLEKCFLRNADGLVLVRRFLDHLRSNDLGRGIIGCDSWAFSYFHHIFKGAGEDVYIVQAFDHVRLAKLFSESAACSEDKPTVFRLSGDGAYVLPSTTVQDSDNKSPVLASDFLDALALHSRGIFGVAWAVWRAALRTIPENRELAENDENPPFPLEDIFWVLPWEKLKQPVIPDNISHTASRVLHNLLLHNGLSIDVLSRVSPCSGEETLQSLFELKQAGLVKPNDNVWRVSARGYPAVRRFLEEEGYLVDKL